MACTANRFIEATKNKIYVECRSALPGAPQTERANIKANEERNEKMRTFIWILIRRE